VLNRESKRDAASGFAESDRSPAWDVTAVASIVSEYDL